MLVEELLLDGIRKITSFARDHEDEFVQMVTKKTRTGLDRSMRDSKRELEQSQARINKLYDIIQRLYEDNIEGIASSHCRSKSFDVETSPYTGLLEAICPSKRT